MRVFGPNATVAQDLEPEYVAISPDRATGQRAFDSGSDFEMITAGRPRKGFNADNTQSDARHTPCRDSTRKSGECRGRDSKKERTIH